MLRILFVLAPLWFVLIPFLGGCSSAALDKAMAQFDNHVTVAVDYSRCSSESQWGPLGLAAKINVEQCKAIVEGMRARDRLRQMEGAQK